MADKTFGALVHDVMTKVVQSTADMDSEHAHIVRRELIDSMQEVRDNELSHTQQTGVFTAPVGKFGFDLEDKLAKRVVRPVTLHWAESTSNSAELFPPDPDGVRQVSEDEFQVHLGQNSSNSNYVGVWEWKNRVLRISPPSDGTVVLFVRYIKQPKIFKWSHNGAAFTYSSINEAGTEVSHAGIEIDSQTDSAGWLETNYQWLVALTVRNLYLGVYQAKDPKGVLAETWIARVNDLMNREKSRYERSQGNPTVRGYLI